MSELELELKSAKYKQRVFIDTSTNTPCLKSTFAYNPSRGLKPGRGWSQVISSEWTGYKYIVCWPFKTVAMVTKKDSGVLIWMG